ncbi:hypothetical protein Bbelb_200200 [Branchiostoma belcheri]|nr:hypothetical protein Bbelb_200200 [Branchiostoma belcheri]
MGQVNSMSGAASEKLYLLKRLRRFSLSTADLTTIYTCYVRPILEYGVPAWSPGLTQSQVGKLERLQKRACRNILGDSYTTYSCALQRLELTTLAERREQLCVKFARTLFTSEYREWLPPTRREVSGRATRNSQKLNCPRARTNRYSNSPIPYMCSLLNKYGQ